MRLYRLLYSLIKASFQGDLQTKSILEQHILEQYRPLGFLMAVGRLSFLLGVCLFTLNGLILLGLSASHYMLSMAEYHMLQVDPWAADLGVFFMALVVPATVSWLVSKYFWGWYSIGITLERYKETGGVRA